MARLRLRRLLLQCPHGCNRLVCPGERDDSREVLQGFDDEAAFQRARLALTSLPIVESPMTEGVYLDAADLYRRARRAGFTVRSSVDCLIDAIRHHLPVLHIDRDYDRLARVSPLHAIHVGRRTPSSHTAPSSGPGAAVWLPGHRQ